MKSPVMKIVVDASLLISALAAVHYGMVEFGMNMLGAGGMLAGFATYVRYLFAAAGLVSLFAFFTGCHCGGECGCK